MASTTQEVREFLDELVTKLTDMHVQASAAERDPSAIGGFASAPSELIERAQNLAQRLDDEGDTDEPQRKTAAAAEFDTADKKDEPKSRASKQ